MDACSAIASWRISSRFWPVAKETNDETRYDGIADCGVARYCPPRANQFGRMADLRRERPGLALQRAHANRRSQCRSAEPAVDLSDRCRTWLRNNAAGVRWDDVHRRTFE